MTVIRIDMTGRMDVYASHRIEVPAADVSVGAILGAVEGALRNHDVVWEHEGVEVNQIDYGEDTVRVWDVDSDGWVSLEDWLANREEKGK